MLQMMHDKVLVSRTKKPERSKDGLIYTNEQGIKTCEGTVVAVNQKSGLMEGDYVIFGEYNGTEIIHEGEKLLILCEEDIFAIDPEKGQADEQ